MLIALVDGTDAKPLMLAWFHYGQHVVTIRDAAPCWWTGCDDLFRLEVQHIAEGADHVLSPVSHHGRVSISCNILD